MYKSADLILKQWLFQVLHSCAISLAIQLPDTCISTGTSPRPHTSNMIESEVHLLTSVWQQKVSQSLTQKNYISFVWTEKEPRHWSFKINEYINHTNLYSSWIRPAPFQTVRLLMNHSFYYVFFFYILINHILWTTFYHVNQLRQDQAVVLYRFPCQSPPLVSAASRGFALSMH